MIAALSLFKLRGPLPSRRAPRTLDRLLQALVSKCLPPPPLKGKVARALRLWSHNAPV